MASETDPFPNLRSAYKTSGQKVNQLSQNLADIKFPSAQAGERKIRSGESKGKVGAKSWDSRSSASIAWGHREAVEKFGMESNRRSGKRNSNAWPNQTSNSWSSHGSVSAWTQQTNGAWRKGLLTPQPVISLSQVHVKSEDKVDSAFEDSAEYDNDDDSDVAYDSDDLDDYDHDYDSDASQKSHETCKKSKWLKTFFKDLEKLTVDNINSPERQWHCPACQGGPGSINWYQGLQSLMIHAKTKKARRAKLHREFIVLLDEEMRKRGIYITASGDVFGKWEGLNERVKDHEIVWPPMVVIMNTRYQQDENGKWIGMGNQELLDYFSLYAALKARHSYGPQGHRGMSVLIFESSPAGYLEAARLHKHFKEQKRDKDAWDCSHISYCPGGKRQLYGYMAVKEDLDIFNQHSPGKSKLKFEMKSYQEMVESQIKHINYSSQQISQLKEKVVKEQMQSQALAESLGRVSGRLCQTMKENRTMRQRMKLQHEQNREEMDAQEIFFKDQINIIYQAIESKEDKFEKLWGAAQEKVKQQNASLSTAEDGNRTEENAMMFQAKKMEEFEAEREELMNRHQDRKFIISRRYWEELIELEKEFENKVTFLMEKYSPGKRIQAQPELVG